jgi:IrrE N-terminal-like domain
MKLKVNQYLNKICSLVGEVDRDQAVAALVRSYRDPGASLEDTATRLGVTEIQYESLPFEGGIFRESKKTIIKINSSSPPVRRNFTLAHELGHLIVAASLNQRRQKECSRSQNLERVCDSVAVELLMPVEQMREFVLQLGRQSPEKLGAIAGRFGVSLEAAARRVHSDLGLWKLPMGLWEYGTVVRELWFVGKRPWKSPHQWFSAFDLAVESNQPVITREYYPNGLDEKLVDLKAFHIGKQMIVGVIAT